MSFEEEQSPRQQFLQDFEEGLKEGGEAGVQKMVASCRRVSVALTGIPDNWGNPGDAMYELLVKQMDEVAGVYAHEHEARTVLYLNDGGISRLQILHNGESLMVQPTGESARRVIANWNRQ